MCCRRCRVVARRHRQWFRWHWGRRLALRHPEHVFAPSLVKLSSSNVQHHVFWSHSGDGQRAVGDRPYFVPGLQEIGALWFGHSFEQPARQAPALRAERQGGMQRNSGSSSLVESQLRACAYVTELKPGRDQQPARCRQFSGAESRAVSDCFAWLICRWVAMLVRGHAS